nr:hypothetical protein Iba_chr04aCG3260 [Ipomoea batatas]
MKGKTSYLVSSCPPRGCLVPFIPLYIPLFRGRELLISVIWVVLPKGRSSSTPLASSWSLSKLSTLGLAIVLILSLEGPLLPSSVGNHNSVGKVESEVSHKSAEADCALGQRSAEAEDFAGDRNSAEGSVVDHMIVEVEDPVVGCSTVEVNGLAVALGSVEGEDPVV